MYVFAIFHFFSLFSQFAAISKKTDKITIDSDLPIGIIFEAYFDECCINKLTIPSNLKTTSTANTQHREMQLQSTQEYSVKSLITTSPTEYHYRCFLIKSMCHLQHTVTPFQSSVNPLMQLQNQLTNLTTTSTTRFFSSSLLHFVNLSPLYCAYLWSYPKP